MTTYDAIDLTQGLPFTIVSTVKVLPFFTYYHAKNSSVAPTGPENTYIEGITLSSFGTYNLLTGRERYKDIALLTESAFVINTPYFHFGDVSLLNSCTFVSDTPSFYLENIVEVAGVTFSVICPNLKFGYTALLADGTVVTEGLSLTGKLVYSANGQFLSFGVPDTGRDVFASTAAMEVAGFIVRPIFIYNGISAVTNTIPEFEVITLAIAGNLDTTLEVMTISAYGGWAGAATLSLLTCDATGLVGMLGGCTDFLPLLECTGTGTVTTIGVLEETIPMLTCTATAILGMDSTADISMPVLEITGTGFIAGSATCDITIPSITCYSNGKVAGRFTDEILRHKRY